MPDLAHTLYAVLATLGGTLLVCQTAATLLGFGGDGDGEIGTDFDADAPDVDVDVDVDGDAGDAGGDDPASHSPLVKALSLRAVTAGMTFAGLAGLAGTDLGWPAWRTVLAAVFAAVASGLVVGKVMSLLHELGADGTVSNRTAAGTAGTVYVRVPGGGAGVGKVQITHAGRTVEMAARTPGPDLPAGTPITVTAVLDEDTAEVTAAPAQPPTPPAAAA